jgi:hypothetical protein
MNTTVDTLSSRLQMETFHEPGQIVLLDLYNARVKHVVSRLCARFFCSGLECKTKSTADRESGDVSASMELTK